jgi:hypothetical protein
MSIRLLARDLYRLQQEVTRLEKELAEAALEKHEDIQARLRKARSQKMYLQRALDGRIGR